MFHCVYLGEEGYWNSSPCSSDSHNGRDCSPSRYKMTNLAPRIPFGHQATTSSYYPVQCDQTEQQYEEVYYGPTSSGKTTVPFVRVVKRRTTANKKERRRTQSINSAFAYLRDCIPNVPSDTKLSKVTVERCSQFEKTLLTMRKLRLFSDKDSTIGHIVHYVFEWCLGRWSRSSRRLSSWIGAILTENQCRTQSEKWSAGTCSISVWSLMRR